MAGSDLTGLLIVGAIIVGGIYLMQNPQILQNLGVGGAPIEEAPVEEEAVEEEPEAEAEPEPYPVPVPYPVPIPTPGLSRRQICSRYYGGSCNGECRQYGFGSKICQQCIGYCGPPQYDEPNRPRPRPIVRPRTCPVGTRWNSHEGKCVKIYGGPGPSPRQECPRGQRFDWTKRKCVTVPKPTPTPTPKPEPKPTPAPAPTTPSQPPATSNYGCSCGGW